MSAGIDFVVTWVDASDKAWHRERAKYKEEYQIEEGVERYRDWDLLKYWFRGVEKYAPWVRKIHFITYGHVPEWLNRNSEKVNVVMHQDYIPAEYLPTFNSNVLELFLHKIEGLSENFVYFNDDMFLIRDVQEKDFFVKGKPCDMLAFQPVVANPANPMMSHIFLNNSLVLSKYFDKRKNVKKNWRNYYKIGYPPLYFFYNLLELAFPLYTGFYTVHGPSAFCKTTFEMLWENEELLLKRLAKNRFRSDSDVSQYLFREWQKLSGEFCPKNIHKGFSYFELGKKEDKLTETIQKQRSKIICINDSRDAANTKLQREQLQLAFEQILSEKSSFEK